MPHVFLPLLLQVFAETSPAQEAFPATGVKSPPTSLPPGLPSVVYPPSTAYHPTRNSTCISFFLFSLLENVSFLRAGILDCFYSLLHSQLLEQCLPSLVSRCSINICGMNDQVLRAAPGKRTTQTVFMWTVGMWDSSPFLHCGWGR